MKNNKMPGKSYALSVDSKGRITIPAKVRRLWQLKEGDVIYLRVERGQGTGVVKKAVDPFEVLSDDALEQSRTGKTTTFESLRSELGVDDE